MEMHNRYYEHIRACSETLRQDFPDWTGKEVLAEARRRQVHIQNHCCYDYLL